MYHIVTLQTNTFLSNIYNCILKMCISTINQNNPYCILIMDFANYHKQIALREIFLIQFKEISFEKFSHSKIYHNPEHYKLFMDLEEFIEDNSPKL